MFAVIGCTVVLSFNPLVHGPFYRPITKVPWEAFGFFSSKEYPQNSRIFRHVLPVAFLRNGLKTTAGRGGGLLAPLLPCIRGLKEFWLCFIVFPKFFAVPSFCMVISDLIVWQSDCHIVCLPFSLFVNYYALINRARPCYINIWLYENRLGLKLLLKLFCWN